MATQSLFTSQTPASGDNSDGGAAGIVTATTIRFAQAGYCFGIRYFSTVTVGGTYTGQMWQVTAADTSPAGTSLASKVGSTPSSAGWNTITFDTPVAVSTATLYRFGLHNSAGRYVSTGNFFGVGDLVNGDLTADVDGDNPIGLGSLNQGTFAANAAAGTYPSSSFNHTCYFIDTLFDTSLPSSIAPTGLAVPLALGAPSVAQALTTAPTGLAVAVGFGTPSVAQTFTVSPAGLPVPVGLGQPTVRMTIQPTGLAVPVSFGQPTVTSDAPPPTPERTTGSWYGLMGVLDVARQEYQEDLERPPVACPNDGEPLRTSIDGVIFCPFDGWQPYR